MQIARTLALVGSLAAAAAGAHAQTPSAAPDTSAAKIVVASPELGGGYANTVLLTVPAPDGRHFGFILNRPTQTNLASLFPGHQPSAKVPGPVFFGGPEMTTAIFAVVKSQATPGPASMQLLPGLYVVYQEQEVDQVIEQHPQDARFFVGFVVWRPGELADEYRKGAWYALDPEVDIVMKRDTGDMWKSLVERARGTQPAPGQKRPLERVEYRY